MKARVLWLVPPGLGGRIHPELARACQVLTVQSIPEVLLFLRTSSCDAVVLSCAAADPSLDDALLEIRRLEPSIHIVLDCVEASVQDAVRLAKLGAHDVWVGEVPAATMVDSLRSALEGRQRVVESANPTGSEPWRASLVGQSEAMQRIIDVIRLVAARRSTVLITGETGTGKEVVARAIHSAGGRGNMPFVAVNCAAIPENLIEAELFGHAKGAFTGAVQSRAGRFEQANGGTIFLDEIGELLPPMQVKLLRVLQEREVQRLGSGETVGLNIRVIAATNVDLEEAVAARRFREDLFYRLNVVPLHLPPLRERARDIPALVGHFLDKICGAEQVVRKSVTPSALTAMTSFSWPGNIRQLEHSVEMAVVLSGDRALLDTHDFAVLQRGAGTATESESRPMVHVPDAGLDFEQTVCRIEHSILTQALRKCYGNKARAAELLRMKRTTLLARLKALEERAGATTDIQTPSSGLHRVAAATG